METLAAVAALFAVVCVALLITGRNSIQASYITLLFFVVAMYMIGNYFEIAHHSLEATKIGLFIRFIAVPFIPTLWYFCVRKYCGLSFKHKWHAALFLVVPTIFVVLCFTWESNHLYINDIYYAYSNGYGNPTIEFGPLQIVRNVYQFSINLLGIITIFIYRIKGTRHFKKQAVLFLVSILIPVSNTMTYFILISGYYVDITPYTLLLATTVTLMLYFVSYINLTDIIRYNTIDTIREGILYFDKDGQYLGSNAAAASIFPSLETVSIGTNVEDMGFLPLDSLSANNEKITSEVIEFSIETKENVKTYTISKSQINRGPKTIGYSLIVNNITQMKQLMTAMEEKAKRDALTGLYNKGFLLDYGQILLDDTNADKRSVSLIMMDIDYFKKVNDTYGHPYGDYVLKETAELCQAAFRKSDFIIRYGGEEFCILMPDTIYSAAISKAEQVREQIANHVFEQDGISICLTVSMGISCKDSITNITQVDELIKMADEKLYISKQSGRNRIS